MKRVVMFSGGIGSWAAAKRVAERHGTGDLTLLFSDTLTEDPDLYRFLGEAAAGIGGELVRLCDGRDIWQVFRDERFLGNHRIDPCSKLLKRLPADRWLAEHCDPADTVVYVGIDWTESHRYDRLRERRKPWVYEAPLCEAPYLTKRQMLDSLRAQGIEPPRLYALGFAHNNCGGGCVKAGIGHFAHLLKVLPDVYATWERNEQELRETLGGKAAILTDRRGGERHPMTLRDLRKRIQGGGQVDMFEIGGCGCFSDEPEAA
jgi:hypothetical protein